MLKVSKILLIVCIMSLFCMGTVLATENEAEITAQVQTVTPLSNLPEANLGLNNILNVILISIGILLILFAIAILIRLKNN